jgi:hypothetical protein
MASIDQPVLEITKNTGSSRVSIRVTTRLRLSEAEYCLMTMMQERCKDLRFVTGRCEIWSDDAGFNGGDDWLMTMSGSPTITADAASRSFVLEWRNTGVSSSTLDEDDSIFDDGDEVYAKVYVTFKGFQTSNASLNRNSEVFEGKF